MQTNTKTFTAVKEVFGTRHYAEFWRVKYAGEDFAELQCSPYSSIINPLSAIVRITNRWLYSGELWPLVDRLLEEFGLSFKSISRIDVCADFLSFKYNYKPEQLIKDFVSQKIRKVGRAVGTVDFRQRRDGMHYNGLKFGTRESDACVYLYNKSLELAEVKDKPHIRDAWRAAGLEVQEGWKVETINGKKVKSPKYKDVWRLEVSLKSGALGYEKKQARKQRKAGELHAVKWTCADAPVMDIVDAKTGAEVTPEVMSVRDNLQVLYNTFVRALFSFRMSSPTDTNISRAQRIALLDETGAQHRVTLRNVAGSTRFERMLVRQLWLLPKLYNWGREWNKGEPLMFQEPNYVQAAQDSAERLAKSCDLSEWLERWKYYWTASPKL